MENVDELIEQYRQEAAQFTLSPRPAVWQHIDAEINPPRRKRRFFIIWFLLGALAAFGFYATGTRYKGHSTTETIGNKKAMAAHEKQPLAATIPTIYTEHITTQGRNQRTTKPKPAVHPVIATGYPAGGKTYPYVGTTEHHISHMNATVNELPVRVPTLPVPVPVSLPQAWPYPIERLGVKPTPMQASPTTLQPPVATVVPAITAIPLAALEPQVVQPEQTKPTEWHRPHSRTIPGISYPATAGLAHVPAKLLPVSPLVAVPHQRPVWGINGAKPQLPRLSLMHPPQVLPPVFPLLSPVAAIPNTFALAGLAPLPVAVQTLPAMPQRLPEAALLGIGTTMGTSMKRLGTGKPTLLPASPQWVHTPIVGKTPTDVATAMFFVPAVSIATITPMRHKILPTYSTNNHTPATHPKEWVLQSAMPTHAPSLPIGPVAYIATDYTEEVDEVNTEAPAASSYMATNMDPLPVATLVLLAAQPQPYRAHSRKIAQPQATITDSNQQKSPRHHWAVDITGGLANNNHTVTEPGLYQFIRNYRDSTDAAIRTMQWALGVRYAINSRVSLLLNASLTQTGEEMKSRQWVYGTDTLLVNISSVGPSFASQKVIITGKTQDINGDSTGSIRNTVTYTSLGLGMRYLLLAVGKLSMGMQPSVAMAWRTGSNTYTYDSTAQEWQKATGSQLTKRNTTLGFGLYAEYRLSPSVSVSVMPHYTRFVSAVSQQSPVAIRYSQTSLLATVTWWFR